MCITILNHFSIIWPFHRMLPFGFSPDAAIWLFHQMQPFAFSPVATIWPFTGCNHLAFHQMQHHVDANICNSHVSRVLQPCCSLVPLSSPRQSSPLAIFL